MPRPACESHIIAQAVEMAEPKGPTVNACNNAIEPMTWGTCAEAALTQA
jgi:hypothetical protein